MIVTVSWVVVADGCGNRPGPSALLLELPQTGWSAEMPLTGGCTQPTLMQMKDGCLLEMQALETLMDSRERGIQARYRHYWHLC